MKTLTDRVRAALCAFDRQEDNPNATLGLGHEDAQSMAEFISGHLQAQIEEEQHDHAA